MIGVLNVRLVGNLLETASVGASLVVLVGRFAGVGRYWTLYYIDIRALSGIELDKQCHRSIPGLADG
jgi:hypothetical protein